MQYRLWVKARMSYVETIIHLPRMSRPIPWLQAVSGQSPALRQPGQKSVNIAALYLLHAPRAHMRSNQTPVNVGLHSFHPNSLPCTSLVPSTVKTKDITSDTQAPPPTRRFFYMKPAPSTSPENMASHNYIGGNKEVKRCLSRPPPLKTSQPMRLGKWQLSTQT